MVRYAITDRIRLGGDESERQAKLLRLATRWVAEGLNFVQLREKELAAGALVELAREMLAAFRTRAPAPSSSSTPAPTSPWPPELTVFT